VSAGFALSLSVLTDALLAWWLLFRRREALLRPGGLVAAAFACLAFAVIKGAVLVIAFGRPFLGIHVLHTFLFVSAAAVLALVALGRPRAGQRATRVMAGALALLLAAVGIHSSFLEPWSLRTEAATVAVDPARAGRAELRIGVLADIQCQAVTAHEREAVARIMAAAPDLILIPGDLVQAGSREEWLALVPPMRALLSTLGAPLGVYFVQGNCESVDTARALLHGTGVRLLLDESIELAWRDRRVTLAGIQLRPDAAAAQALLRELGAPGGDDLRILCAHLPDAALALPPGGRVDLVVAGHTHGGQVRLPWVGPLITLSTVPRAVAGGGLHELNGVPIYVSRGIGHEQGDAPRIRFNCPPEVSLLTLATRGQASPAAPAVPGETPEQGKPGP
jgi:predicted MPP superfamily phosphohydrolase